MPLDRSVLGLTSDPVRFVVERGAIVKFAEAIGDPNPAYLRGDVAPPTFPTTFTHRLAFPGLSDIDPARFIHGNEEYTYSRPLRPGDEITCVRRIDDLFVKQGKLGQMTFVRATMEGRDPQGVLVLTGSTTVIVHGKEA